ncbi:MAG: aminotransferase class V-fold PLP-dependent enzyme [Oscillospiraceae bacterium]
MSTPIYDALLKYKNDCHTRCHTPGHSGVSAALPLFAEILPFDATEIAGLDSLYDAKGVISECEENLASLFSVKKSLISAGGCTLAIQAMLALAIKQGEKIAVCRNAHRSVISALALLGAEPKWLFQDSNGLVTPQIVEELFLKENELKAVFITSPDYYGRISDIKKISEVCHRHGVPLLVDNAHGSHLMFFKLNPTDFGADMAACSLHKTLPVLTGGAVLNINNSKFIGNAKQSMALFGSTSPSYLIMSSIDLFTDWAKTAQPQFERVKAKTDSLKLVAASRNILPDFSRVDPIRLTLRVSNIGISGHEAMKCFSDYKVTPEYFDDEYVVLILTPFMCEKDFSAIKKAILNLPEGNSLRRKNIPDFPENETVLLPREAIFSESEDIPLITAENRVASEVICPCPPGIPAVIPGEKISREALEYLLCLGYKKIKVVKQNV